MYTFMDRIIELLPKPKIELNNHQRLALMMASPDLQFLLMKGKLRFKNNIVKKEDNEC